jgi:hypothetical protein
MNPAGVPPGPKGRRGATRKGTHDGAPAEAGARLTSLSTPARSAVGLGREIALPACGFTPRSWHAPRPRTLGPPSSCPVVQGDARGRAGLGVDPRTASMIEGDPHCNEKVCPRQVSTPKLRVKVLTPLLCRALEQERASERPRSLSRPTNGSVHRVHGTTRSSSSGRLPRQSSAPTPAPSWRGRCPADVRSGRPAAS